MCTDRCELLNETDCNRELGLHYYCYYGFLILIFIFRTTIPCTPGRVAIIMSDDGQGRDGTQGNKIYTMCRENKIVKNILKTFFVLMFFAILIFFWRSKFCFWRFHFL